MHSKKWCLFVVTLTIFLAIMDNAESYIGTISGDDIESRAKHSERKVTPHGNSDAFPNKQKRLKMRKMQVKRNLSQIKIIFIGLFNQACSCV